MNERQLAEILNKLKNITPDPKYAERSRFLILSSNREYAVQKPSKYAVISNWLKMPRLAMTTATIAAFIIIAALTVAFMPRSQSGLVAEANEINASIQIKLDEIKYYFENQPTAATDPVFAQGFQNLLQKSLADLKEASQLSKNPDTMEEAVGKIKEAESTFLEMKLMIQQK